MASLTLVVGAFSGEITATNVAAQRVLENVLSAGGYDGDPLDEAAKLQWILERVKEDWVGASRNYEANQAAQIAFDAAHTDPGNDWI